MKLGQLLEAIAARQSIAMIKSALKQHDLNVGGVGWAATAGRIEELAKTPNGKDVLEILTEIYKDNILYTQKAVFLWMIEIDIAAKLCEVMSSFVDDASPYGSTYPLPLSNKQLRSVTALGVPTRVEISDRRHTLVFASKREKIEELPLSAETMPQDLVDAGFTQFYGKKRHMFQVFDSISVDPARGLVEMRIDYGKSLSEKDILAFKTGLANRFNKLVKAALGHEQLLGHAVNMAPALEPLYKGSAWVVYDINHQNDAGYSNSNRGRNRTDDVRSDQYHKTGEAAVGGVQLWQVSAAFPSQHTVWSPRLVLEGHSSMLNSLVPFMDIARVLDCATREEYDQVFDALLDCLGIAANAQKAEAEAEAEVI